MPGPCHFHVRRTFAGDVPTVIMTPEGGISPSWGTRDFSVTPDKETVLNFLRILTSARENGLAKYLVYGRMIPSPALECDYAPFGNRLPSLIMTSWEYENEKITLMINPFSVRRTAVFDGKETEFEAYEVRIMKI